MNDDNKVDEKEEKQVDEEEDKAKEKEKQKEAYDEAEKAEILLVLMETKLRSSLDAIKVFE